jgi:hypothetical protein
MLDIGPARPWLWLTSIASLLYASVFITFVWGLGFDMFRSDIVVYWRNSSDWERLFFSTAWVPGYSLMIAFVRAVTFDSLPPLAVMWPLSAIFYVLSINIAFRLLWELGVRQSLGFTLIYAVFPFVGLSGAILPGAGSMAMTFFLLTALTLWRQQWLALSIGGATALLAHKALWFMLLPLFAIVFIRQKASRPFMLLSLVPVGVLWIAGTIYHSNVWWMTARSARQLMWSTGALPAFDGLVTSLLSHSAPKLLKGVVVLIVFLAAGVLLHRSLRHQFWLGVAICVGTIGMTAVLNQHEVWAVVRFGRLLVIPLAYFGVSALGVPSRFTVPTLVLAFLAGIVTNFAFAIYTTRYFFSAVD